MTPNPLMSNVERLLYRLTTDGFWPRPADEHHRVNGSSRCKPAPRQYQGEAEVESLHEPHVSQ